MGVVANHRRRLAHLGQHPLDAPPGAWATTAPPPRDGNHVEILIDGEVALARMVKEMRAARSSIHLSGWFLSPEFVMAEEDGVPVVVRNLLAEVAQNIDVRVLLWGGAPLPLFRPSRRMARAVRQELLRAGPIRCELDTRERPLHCHHEKTIVIDGELAFVGGIDLTALAGDRRDSSLHPSRVGVGWHDVASLVRGPVVADVAAQFVLRWNAVTGEQLSPPTEPKEAGTSRVQFIRTVPENCYPALPRGSFSILETYARAIQSAERFIYIESQYLWSPEIVQLLCDKVRKPPSDRFRLLIVLPGAPYGGADDTRGALGDLIDAGGDRVLGCGLYAPAGRLADLIYVHAKVAVFDDRLLIVGSANLNDHSMFNDSEAAIVTDDAELVADTRQWLWAEHLECEVGDVSGDPIDLIDDRWRPRAEEQHRRRVAGLPATHRVTRLDHVSRRSARLLGPLQGLLVDG